MSKRQENIYNDKIANQYNDKYQIGIGLCYKIITMFGDNKYSHEFCKYIMNIRKENKTCTKNFNELYKQFNLNKI